MNRRYTIIWAVVLLCAQAEIKAQEEVHGIEYGGGVKLFEPFTRQTRTQYRDLGIGPYDVIPADQTAITALAVSPEGHIYGGSTGSVANLFVYFPGYNYIFPLGTIPGHQSIHRSLVFHRDGGLYVGTSLNVDRPCKTGSDTLQGVNSAYRSVTLQIRQDFQNYGGGHIYRYDPSGDETGYHRRLFRINRPCPLEDLGVPVPHEGIYAMIGDRYSEDMYGLTYPGGFLFRFRPENRSTEVIARTVSQMPLGNEMPLISKALVQDMNGHIYCNTYGGYLLKYLPGEARLDTLDVRLPGLKGRWVFNGIECAVADTGGLIYGGTTDGYLFGFDPVGEKMYNYGKPLIETKIRALTIGSNGHLYGIGGEDRTGFARLFRFDTRLHTFEDLGIVQVSHVPYQEWTGLIFDTMVTGNEGSLYLGQSEYRSKLFIYNPE